MKTSNLMTRPRRAVDVDSLFHRQFTSFFSLRSRALFGMEPGVVVRVMFESETQFARKLKIAKGQWEVARRIEIVMVCQETVTRIASYTS